MRALPRCRASEGVADIGIYNKREDSLCGCFVAVAVGFSANLVLSLMVKKDKHSNVNFEFRITVWVKKRTEEFDSGSD